MRFGVPKEIKPQENRIGLTPNSVKILTSNGHEVLVENNGERFRGLPRTAGTRGPPPWD